MILEPSSHRRGWRFLLWCVLVSGVLMPKHVHAAWPEGKTYSLDGVRCSVSAPVLVARSKGFLWFPTLVHLGGDELVAVMQNRHDACTDPYKTTALVARSRDGGLHWGESRQGFYGECPLRLADGTVLLPSFYLARQSDGLVGYCQRFVQGKEEVEWIKDGMQVTGWPGPDGDNMIRHGMAGFVFNGQTVALKEGGWLATLYGHFRDAQRYALVTAASTDGRHWKVRSIVADEHCKLRGAEGPCEAALCRLKDGRLMCIFRNEQSAPYGQCWSSDEGKTWTIPAAMKKGHSVQPSLAVIRDGMVVLSGGRPGIYLWLNADGTGANWQPIDLAAHHNLFHVAEPVCSPDVYQDFPEKRRTLYVGKQTRTTSSYTETVALDDTHLLVIYDRIPFGWKAIPQDSPETNSVWVVRVTVDCP